MNFSEKYENQKNMKGFRVLDNLHWDNYYAVGGDEGDRTPDLSIANAALSQLSYIPDVYPKYIRFFKMGNLHNKI